MNDRFAADPGQFYREREAMPVTTARALLRHLGVVDQDRALQQKAVNRWLQTHSASPILIESLELGGFEVRPRV